jgi:hypothetical protein
MKNEETLAPVTGILYTAIQSGMSYVDAASEMADNTFGVAAGNTDTLWIVYTDDAVLFMDKGNGVKDINNMFRLGASGSRGNAEDIGRFGVGSKFGALTYGYKITVMTVRDSTYHTFTIDWSEVLQSDDWPTKYKGSGLPSNKAPKFIRDGGTIVLIENIRHGKSLRIGNVFKRQLGMRFMQSFERGNDIIISRSLSVADALAGKFSDSSSLSACVIDDVRSRTTDKGKAVITVQTEDGRSLRARLMYGRLPDGDASMSGVHVSFGGRTIETEQRKFDETRKVPTQFMAMVFLDNKGWKECLNYNKTRITEYREELMAEVANAAHDLLDKLKEETEAARQTTLELNMSNMMSDMLGSMFKDAPDGGLEDGDEDQADTPQPGDNSGGSGEGGGTEAGKRAGTKSGQGKKRAGSFSVSFQFASKGERAGPVYVESINVETKPTFIVTLNTDVRIIASNKEREPANADSLCLLAVYGIAKEIATNEPLRTKMLGEDAENQTPNEVYDELLMRMTPEISTKKKRGAE